jgi:Transposase DDE domain
VWERVWWKKFETLASTNALIHDEGELLACRLTPGNLDDRQPVVQLAAGRGGQLFGDRGSISQAFPDVLLGHGPELLTSIRRNRKNRLRRLWDKLLLRKRALVETINDQWKNSSQIEPTRHRSVTGFMGNLVASLVAYRDRPTKPLLGLRRAPLWPMLVM